MKKIALISAALIVVSASAAMAATPHSIVNSRHNLARGAAADSKEEICIYCHTPHNAVINIPLWNRNNPSTSQWKLYKSSATLSTAAQNSSISADSISLFCMSCHDGKTALGDAALANKNPYYTHGASGDTATGENGAADHGPLSRNYAMIGRTNLADPADGYDLSNTHPIGFDFTAAQAEDNGLRTAPAIMARFAEDTIGKTTPQTFLYKRGGAGENKWFECASCHRVHDPGPSGNFLRLENDRSKLCLACHDK